MVIGTRLGDHSRQVVAQRAVDGAAGDRTARGRGQPEGNDLDGTAQVPGRGQTQASLEAGEGDRAVGGIAPLIICTNCTAVRLSIGEKDLGLFYPAIDRYPGLAHPPVVIESLPSVWGGEWEDAVFIGYHNGKECITRRFTANPVRTQLVLTADETKLRADIPDAVRFVVRLLDQAGNELPYSSEVVQIKLKGPAEVIGPKEFALIGGARGFWIKTLGKVGTVKVSAQTGEFKSETVSIRIR